MRTMKGRYVSGIAAVLCLLATHGIAAPLGKSTSSYTVGGGVTGLNGVLTLSSSTLGLITINANGTFVFPTALAPGSGYTVYVHSAPATQNCALANGSGVIGNANVTSLQVTCTNLVKTYSLGGTVSGLTGQVTLANGAGSLVVTANAPFQFATGLAAGAAYQVTVAIQPLTQTCTVKNGAGVMGTANVSAVSVACTNNPTFSVGGVVTGLSGTLLLAGGTLGTVSMSSNGAFVLPTRAQNYAFYQVMIGAQPTGQKCTINNGTGTVISANVTSVAVVCKAVPPTYTLGGTLSGATGGGMTLGVTVGTDSEMMVLPNGAFTIGAFPAGTSYAVSVATPPVGQSCSVTSGSGVIGNANVTSVLVACKTLSFNVGGSVTGLVGGKTLVLADNAADLLTVSGNGAFTFKNAIPSGSTYGVTVATAPAGQTCAIANPAGLISTANIANVNVTCTTTPTALTWMWAGGAQTAGAAGHYGTHGVAAVANAPGARLNGSSWTDAAGNLWLFGGLGEDSTGTETELNDLWTFTPATHAWTWMAGSQVGNVAGTYGTRGQPAAANAPGGRDGAASWTDGSGNLWLFGGSGFDSTTSDINAGGGTLLNDLWVYRPATGQWTWQGGSSTGGGGATYGTKGVAAAANTPGARFDAATWSDATGNFWLFGGFGIDALGNRGRLGDLWKYAPATGLWTWVYGSNVQGQSGVYGKPGATGSPGGRLSAATWSDALGNLWLFGGSGYDSAGTLDLLNDLWKFSPAAGTWSWVGGSSVADAAGSYSAAGSVAASPGARSGAATRIDSSGNLWLIAGHGFDAQGNPGDLNDGWKFSPSTGAWNWVNGSNTINATDVFGTLNSPSATAVPAARAGAAVWVDAAGHLWMAGGSGIDGNGAPGLLNDVWELIGP